MNLTVRELKSSDTWKRLNNELSNVNSSRRIRSLLLLLTYLQNPDVRNLLDLYIKSGEIERQMDRFYVAFKYTEYVHKEESDLIFCCSKLMSWLEVHTEITLNQFFPLIKLFQNRIRGE